ncbi:MAG: hypoxanthine phosphoribosyltransferase [Anaerolineae bacterium]|nr:hypoxanthine phosphoribosyltransferase [Anaerolineae bacterium]MCB0251398.1 hypoxanthine phosphoribosyltransferase [Anaerolineae bacterium]
MSGQREGDLRRAAESGAVSEVLLSADQIQRRVAELGATVSVDYAGLDLLLIGALRGVTLFMADLMRAVTIPLQIDFLAITSYGARAEAGVQRPVRITKDLEIDVAGRHVLFVEDMVDTGLSLNYMLRLLRDRRPASLHVCTMFNKPRLRLFNLPLRYVGFELPDRYVVGYGLDYRQLYRNLPYVGVLSAGVLLSGD